MARAIHRLKYEDRPEVAKPLAQLVVERGADTLAALPGPVCAVPSHPTRRLERGYDHALVFAAQLARALHRPLMDTWLTRTRETVRQVGLSETQRTANMHGAFRGSPEVQGRPVVLVDDVFTTGATAREAALTLLRAGASTVSVITIARARRVLAKG